MLPTMPISDHLEALRHMLVRIVTAILLLSVIVFFFKEQTFSFLLAPKEYDFVTFRAIEHLSDLFAQWASDGPGYRFEPYHISLIATELSSQFMMHLTASLCLGALLASPYILYQMFLFIAPALYANERRYGLSIGLSSFFLFLLGILMSYYVLFPISFRFLATYQVDPSVASIITLDSYISTFATLTFLMGLVFQLPVISWILAKFGLIDAALMTTYRRHAFVGIMVVAALITPPDVMTLLLVTVPLYLLYEACICLVRFVTRHRE